MLRMGLRMEWNGMEHRDGVKYLGMTSHKMEKEVHKYCCELTSCKTGMTGGVHCCK